jgi:predicted nucleic acid-binding protein
MATGSLTRHEVRTAFRRREAEGVLPSGESASLYDEFTADIAATDIVIQPETADTEREFGAVLEACFSQTPPTFIRTNDALHLASAKVAGEPEFITADMRQRAAAMLMGFTVLP